MTINNKAVVAAVLAGAVVVGGAGAAAAKNTGWKHVGDQFNHDKTAKFAGSKLFYSDKDHHGAFVIRGNLLDLKDNDRSVKFQVKVEGYSPHVWNAPEDANKRVPATTLWDPAMTIVPYVTIQTCQRNWLHDDCSSWRRIENPYYKW